MPQKLTQIINRSSFSQTFFAAGTAFFTYICFYPFRRAYTAATYEDLAFWGGNFKILIIINWVGDRCFSLVQNSWIISFSILPE